MRMLLVEDNRNIPTDVLEALQAQGFALQQRSAGTDALRDAVAQCFDLILVGHTVADMEPTQFCRRLRAQGVATALVAMTDHDDMGKRIELLDAGADDFVASPIDLDELLARVRAVLRRCGTTMDRLCVGPIAIDPRSRIVTVDGEDVEMTEREASLLAYLARRAGVVVSRQEISKNVWKSDATPASNTIDVNIRHLRGKLGAAACYLKTVRGQGYLLQA
jgi:DNA-binding response OmpR family regulator